MVRDVWFSQEMFVTSGASKLADSDTALALFAGFIAT